MGNAKKKLEKALKHTDSLPASWFGPVDNDHRVYLTSDLFEVKEVILIPKNDKRVLDITLPEYEPLMIWEYFGQEENVLKAGDKLTLEMEHFRCLKQMGPLIYTPRSIERKTDWDQRRLDQRAMFQNYLKNFKPELILEIKTKLSDLTGDDEVAYRCFYNSFKMYRCRRYVIEMAQMLISLGQMESYEAKTNEELLTKFSSMMFDQVLVKSLTKILGTNFAMSRNDSQAWYNDSEILFSSFFLFSKALDYMVRFSESIKEQKSFMQSTKGFLSWEEAGAMTVWDGISFLRTTPKEEHQELLKSLKIN